MDEVTTREDRKWRVLALAVACATGAACADGGATGQVVDHLPQTPGSLTGASVLLVTLDTVRADRLGCYGYARAATPRIDGLAREGVRFANAFTPAPSTLPGHASILTGLYPYAHGARVNGRFELGEEQVTLAEILADEGYACAAFVAAYVLDSRYGLDQGFELYDDDLSQGRAYGDGYRERPADQLVDAALAWLGTAVEGRPFFAWVHLFDAHTPYVPPPPYASRFADSPYDGEIAFVDQEVGRLVDGLRALDPERRTIVVVSADHGESLGEHGESYHSLLIYDATMHTPLVLVLPDEAARGLVLERQVSNVDLVPTLLDLLGVAPPAGTRFDGTSWLAPESVDTVYMETLSPWFDHGWSPLYAARRRDAKYVLAPERELYDLERDPHELTNLIDVETARAAVLQAALDRHRERDREDVLESARTLDSETARQLAALGYGGTLQPGESPDRAADLPDPKAMVANHERSLAAVQRIQMGEAEAGLAELRACIEAAPRDSRMLDVAAWQCINLGLLEPALEFATRALAIDDSDPHRHTQVADVYLRRGEPDRAEGFALGALRRDPAFGPALLLLGGIAEARGNAPQAERHYRRAIDVAPETSGASAHAALGMMALRRADHDTARRAFAEALALDAGHVNAHSGLGSSYMATEEYERAIPAFEAVLRVHTRATPVLRMLADAQRRGGDLAGRAATLERLAVLEPRSVAVLLELSQVRFDLGQHDHGIATCERILAIDPRNAVALTNLGVHHAQRGETELGTDYLRRAVEAAPGDARTRAMLGELLMAAGKHAEALEQLEQAAAMDAALGAQVAPAIEQLRAALGRAGGG